MNKVGSIAGCLLELDPNKTSLFIDISSNMVNFDVSNNNPINELVTSSNEWVPL